jgi:hypothetical protein
MPLSEPSPYEVLGVPPTADLREIRLAARSVRQTGRYARQQIQESAALLRNPERRLEIDLQQPLPPDLANKALDLLGPILEQPLSLPDRRPPPPATTLLTLRRTDVEVEFTEPPAMGIGEEPEIPARFTGGLSVLPHVEFPA